MDLRKVVPAFGDDPSLIDAQVRPKLAPLAKPAVT